MTGLDIANELKELSEDMDNLYKVYESITSDLARDEIRKVLAILGDEYNKKANRNYDDFVERLNDESWNAPPP